jgi:hypothetical protein
LPRTKSAWVSSTDVISVIGSIQRQAALRRSGLQHALSIT